MGLLMAVLRWRLLLDELFFCWLLGGLFSVLSVYDLKVGRIVQIEMKLLLRLS